MKLHVSFQIKKNKINERQRVPIYCRVTLNGTRSEFSTKFDTEIDNWNNKGCFIKGNIEEDLEINNRLRKIKNNLYKNFDNLIDNNKTVSLESLRNSYLKIENKKDFLSNYYNKPEIFNFIKKQFKKQDLLLKEIDYLFLSNFKYYLKYIIKYDADDICNIILDLKNILRKASVYNSNKKYKLKKELDKDPIYIVSENIRKLIQACFKNTGYKKSSKTAIILGCSSIEFKEYIESLFEPWMNWNNKGLYNGEINYGWDMDHIIPISSAKTEEEVIRLNHYTNFQPLCSYTNRYIKRNKL